MAALSALLLFASAAFGAAPKAVISDLSLDTGDGSVLLSATLSAPLGTESLQALRGGVPLAFLYRVRLTKRGALLGESVVREAVITHTLSYDPVRETFLFEADGYPTALRATTRDQAEALRWLTEVRRWPLWPLADLSREARYRVRVMATLRSAELPSVLGYLFFFTSIFNQDTPWRQLDFAY